jgi:6-phosphogluconate dehydrogenase
MRLASSVFGCGMAGSDSTKSDVGVIGLDVASGSVALNLADHQFEVAACDWGARRTPAPPACGVRAAANARELMANLRQPRTIFIVSSAGGAADSIIEELLPGLEDGDLLMDAGNSYFKDTARRSRRLTERGVQFMGIGLAGGPDGSREGGIVMAGGGREARERTRPLLEALAATVRGQRCVCHLETAAAAHFAKMVHAGIEQALLQLVSETFDLTQRALPPADGEMAGASEAWRAGALNGYLVEMTGRGSETGDKPGPRRMLEQKLEAARQDAQGGWMARSALELEVSIPTIDAAVGTLAVAPPERQRRLMATPSRQPAGRFGNDAQSVLDELQGALQAATIIAYAQGLALLAAASKHHAFHYELDDLCCAWRGGARLRTALLEDMAAALAATPDLPDLLCDEDMSEKVMARQECLRHAVWRAYELDMVVPALLASLDSLDANKGAWLPVNLIQAPRWQPGQIRVRECVRTA